MSSLPQATKRAVALSAFLKESARSGLIASIVMMPAGFLFKQLGLRVGHYGPKLGAVLFGEPSQLVLFVQHLVIGWLSAIPLLFILLATRCGKFPVLTGTLYGIAYYVLVNSLILPLAFGDPTPWRLGFSFIYPSLIVHIIFGASIGFTARGFLRKHRIGEE